MREITDDWTFSFSQLQTYSGCGEKYRWMTLEDDRPLRQPASWLVHGNSYHSATALWHYSGQTQDLTTIYLEEWDKELAKQLEVQPDLNLWNKPPRTKTVEQDLKLMKAKGLEQVKKYEREYAKGDWYIVDADDELILEVGFTVKFGKHNVRGFLDQLRYYPKQGIMKVVDLKTGNVSGTDPRQLGLYGEAVKQLYGLEVEWGQFWYSKLDDDGRYSDNYQLKTFDAAYWLQEFTMMRGGIDAGVFLPNPGDNCRTCDALSVCRAKPYL